jgi:hypothetical protein
MNVHRVRRLASVTAAPKSKAQRALARMDEVVQKACDEPHRPEGDPSRGPKHGGWSEVRVDLRCGWCGREVEARGLIHRVTARLFLNPADIRYNVANGRPRCRVCGGPLLLENWTAESARSLFDLLADCLSNPRVA